MRGSDSWVGNGDGVPGRLGSSSDPWLQGVVGQGERPSTEE